MKKEKKFRVRLKHYNEGRYCIQYAHYRWFPIWMNLMVYIDGVGYHDLHLPVKEAEEIASGVKSYDNVLNLFWSQMKKELEYKKKKLEEQQMEIPFKVKDIL